VKAGIQNVLKRLDSRFHACALKRCGAQVREGQKKTIQGKQISPPKTYKDLMTRLMKEKGRL
jgi:hypothetical protein